MLTVVFYFFFFFFFFFAAVGKVLQHSDCEALRSDGIVTWHIAVIRSLK